MRLITFNFKKIVTEVIRKIKWVACRTHDLNFDKKLTILHSGGGQCASFYSSRGFGVTLLVVHGCFPQFTLHINFQESSYGNFQISVQ